MAEHLQALAATLDPRAAATLSRMPDQGRQLLAARAYLRAGGQIGDRWSWSAAQAQAFAQSAEKASLDAAIARVNCIFSAANPGYTLFVNPQFRSLDIQLQRWNSNDSVERAAASMQQAAAAARLPPPASPGATRQFSEWLRGQQPRPVPTLAAPGLSPHGQARAVDFQVQLQGSLVAAADSASIAARWVEPGWAQKLATAIQAAGGFTGPLKTPDEPWHYTYQPAQSPAGRATGPPECQAPATLR
ncbi:MAG: hypothetical protein ABW278_04380 [Steroidobacteraceae bacterium]